MQRKICWTRTAASFSVNLPLAMISSKSSPPLQILKISGENLLGHYVVSFLILEILKHSHDIRMILSIREQTYQSSEDVDFIEEHSLLILVHVTLSEDLYSSLSSSLSVNAHSDLTKSA